MPDLRAISELGGQAIAAALVFLGCLIAAALGRRRLPAGVSDGLFVGGMTGLVLLHFLVSYRAAAGRPLLVAGALGGIALLWTAAALWVERRSIVAPELSALRRRLALQVAGLSALLALAALLHLPQAELRPFVMLGVLIIAAALVGRRRPEWRDVLPGAGLIALTLLGLRASESWLPRVVFMAGGVAVVLLIGIKLTDWRRRVQVWRTSPERLMLPPAARPFAYGAVLLAASVAALLGACFVPGQAGVAFGVWLAALAVLSVAHRWESRIVGAYGLALVAEGIISAAIRWLPTSFDVLIGLQVAMLFLLWLARLWQQQIEGTEPWTLAGRLVQPARQLSYLLAAAQVPIAIRAALDAQTSSWGLILASALLVVVEMAFLSRDQRDAFGGQSWGAAVCFWLIAAGVAVPAALDAARGVAPRPVMWAAVFTLVLATLSGRVRPEQRAMHDGWIGGLLPSLIVGGLVLTTLHLEPEVLVPACVTLGLALYLRFGMPGPSRPAPQPVERGG